VAAVFSYVVLGAGFFTTQKSQEVVHTGVSQASSNLEVSGPVVVVGSSTTADNVAQIRFYLQLAAGGTAVDMDKVSYTVSTTNEMAIFESTDVTTAWYNWADGNELLDTFEFVLITIPKSGSLPAIGVNDRFTVEIKPDVGASYPIQRNAPPNIDGGVNYEVY